MRKRGKRIQHKARTAPTMVALHLSPEISLTERLAVMALTSGNVEKRHFNVLWECHAMLCFGGHDKADESLQAITDLSAIALENIRSRYLERGTIRATGDELAALNAMVDFSESWWKNQSGKRFSDAYQHVGRCLELYEALAHNA